MNNLKKLLVVAVLGAQLNLAAAASSDASEAASKTVGERLSYAAQDVVEFAGKHKTTLSLTALALAVGALTAAGRVVKSRAAKKNASVAQFWSLVNKFGIPATAAAVALVGLSGANDHFEGTEKLTQWWNKQPSTESTAAVDVEASPVRVTAK